MSDRKFLCLFSSDALRLRSCFGENGGWRDHTDAGTCDFVPHVLDGEAFALAHSGLFVAATAIVSAADLEEAGGAFEPALRAFVRPGLSFEIVAAESAIGLCHWIAGVAPDLLERCRQDGEVRFESFSWWRARAERHFSGGPADAGGSNGDDDPSSEALRAFVARRRGV